VFDNFKSNMRIVLRTWSGKIGVILLLIQIILALYAVAVYYPDGMREYEQGKQGKFPYLYPATAPPCWAVDEPFHLINISLNDVEENTYYLNEIPQDLQVVDPNAYKTLKASLGPILQTGVFTVVYKEYTVTINIDSRALPNDIRMLLAIVVPSHLQDQRIVNLVSGWMFIERPDGLVPIIFYQGQLYAVGNTTQGPALITIYGKIENVTLDNGQYAIFYKPETLYNYANNKWIGNTLENTLAQLYEYLGLNVYVANETATDNETTLTTIQYDPRVLFATAENGEMVGLPGEYTIKIGLYALTYSDYADEVNQSLGVEHFLFILMPNCYGFFGTDTYSRPISLGLLLGLPYAFLLGFTVTFISTFLGAIYGTLAGYWKDLRGEALMRIADIVLSLPFLPILIAISFSFGTITLKSLALLMIALSWAGPVIVVRSMALQISEQLYIEAAKAVGVSTQKIVFKHIFPQIYPYTMAIAVLSIPGIIVAEASLSLLGFGDPAAPTWGKMLQLAYNSQAVTQGWWWLYVFPGLALVVFSATFLLIGRAIEPIVAPKLQK